MNEIQDRLEGVRERIRGACLQAGRAPSSVRLVAVSKRQPDARLRDAYEAGQIEFGENYVQELNRKRAILPEARFHLIGKLQTNKAKKAVTAAMIHTIDSERLVRALERGLGEDQELEVLVEVNLASEEQKAGVAPEQVEPLLLEIESSPRLRVQGLMCIPPLDGPSRPWFGQLRRLADALRDKTGLELPELSMGMSSDFEDAVLEGATLVRVGTAVFGPRAIKP